MSDLAGEIVEKQNAEQKGWALTEAVKLLLLDYQKDTELTAFQLLACEDFHDYEGNLADPIHQ